MKSAMRRAALKATAFLAIAGCAVTPIDLPLKPTQMNVERRTVEYQPDRPLIILSFSGGGSRATALAAAVTARLDRITYPVASGRRKLSQDVALVSSVSGGSVFAAWIGLYGLDHDKVAAFERKVGAFDGIGYLAGRAVNPFTWADLALTRRTRIDVLQDMLSQFLDTTATMAAINEPGKPLVVLNASDMTAGEVFSFTPGTLDDMCLSFDDLPIVAAVSASAAVPIAISPLLIKNTAWFGCEGKRQQEGDWINPLLTDGGAYANIEAFRTARYRASLYGDKKLAYRDERYVRLLDGGLADNLGLTAARRVLMDPDSPAYVYPALGEGRLRRLVVISVNARSDVRNDLDGTAKRTTIPEMISAVTSVPIDATTANVAAAFRGFIGSLMNDRDTLRRNGLAADFKIYPVEIDFDELPTGTPQEIADRDNVKSITTTWTISPEEVRLIDKVAGELLWRHPCFNALMDDIKASGEREAIAPTNIRCSQQ